ncbi:hypothetical protein P7C70_g9174, partial [Phenoliferia sp. Uapishka_3]
MGLTLSWREHGLRSGFCRFLGYRRSSAMENVFGWADCKGGGDGEEGLVAAWAEVESSQSSSQELVVAGWGSAITAALGFGVGRAEGTRDGVQKRLAPKGKWISFPLIDDRQSILIRALVLSRKVAGVKVIAAVGGGGEIGTICALEGCPHDPRDVDVFGWADCKGGGDAEEGLVTTWAEVESPQSSSQELVVAGWGSA